MTPFTLAITIDRPVDAVFAFLADSANMPRWYEAVQRVDTLTPGPLRAGTLHRMARRLPHGTVENVVEASEVVPHERLTLRSVAGPTPFQYRYSLEPTRNGTRLALEGAITGQGLEGPAGLLAPLAPTLFKRGMAENLRVLKRILEGE